MAWVGRLAPSALSSSVAVAIECAAIRKPSVHEHTRPARARQRVYNRNMTKVIVVTLNSGSERQSEPMDDAAAQEAYDSILNQWRARKNRGGPVRVGASLAVDASDIAEVRLSEPPP